MVVKVALKVLSLRVLQLSPVRIIPPLLHIHIHFNTTIIRRTSGLSLRTFQRSSALSDIGQHWNEKYFYIRPIGYICDHCFCLI